MNKKSKRAKTMIERMGFRDRDLKTPEHDYLMMWAYEEQNLIDLTETIYNIPDDAFEEFKKDIEIRNLDFEKPIQIYQGAYHDELRYIAGYVDCYFEFYLKKKDCGKSIHVIEFKSNIESYGEMLREIEYYRSYWAAAKYTILTFDDVEIPCKIFLRKNINVYQIPQPQNSKQSLLKFMN